MLADNIEKNHSYTRCLIEASSDPFITICPQGKIEEVNDAVLKITGVSRRKMIGSDLLDYFTEPDKVRKAYQLSFTQELVTNYPLTIKHINGNLKNIIYNSSVFKENSGKITGLFITLKEITERKNSNNKFKRLFESAPDAMVIVNTKGEIEIVNIQTEKLFGYTKNEIIGCEVEKLIPSRFIHAHYDHRNGYFDTPKTRSMGSGLDLFGLAKDGSEFPVEIRLSPLETENGMLISVAIRDVTTKKQSEEKLKEFKYFFNNSHDLICIANMDGYFEILNPNWEKLLGYSDSEMYENQFLNFIHPDDIDSTLMEMEKLKMGATTINFENRYRKKDGTYIWLNWNTTPDLFTKKLYAIARDITKQKELEFSTEKIQSYTRSLIETSLDPQIIKNSEGLITDVNEATVLATGIPRGEIIGTSFSKYFSDPQKAEKAYHDVFKEGIVRNRPLAIKHISGTITDVLYNATLLKDENGKVKGIFASTRDITEIKKAEEEIQTLNLELEQRIVELESFSYSVSHDLRAPLRGIDGFIAIFLDNYLNEVDTEGQRLLGNVRKNINKMGGLIDELLSLSKIGNKDIVITSINMKQLVNIVLEELNEMKGEAQIIINDLDFACGDIVLIKQVLVNLLSNAFKYSNKKEHPIIEIGSETDGNEIHFYVKDNGIGFDMEYLNKLFGVFQRLHDSQEYQGTGVGLAIVKRIISRHGGKVWAVGSKNEGATFYFSLNK